MNPLKTNIWSQAPGADAVERPDPAGHALEVWGYTDRVSYAPGDVVSLHLHTHEAQCAVRVVRDDGAGETVYRRDRVDVVPQSTPADAAVNGCGWAVGLTIALDAGWQPGPYVVVLRVERGGQAVEREAFFVLRNAAAGRAQRVAMVLTTGTWAAYNDWGGANAYRSTVAGESIDVLAPVLSLRRPWARGFIRLPADAPRHADVPDLPKGRPPRYPWIDWALRHGWSRHYLDAGWAHYERPFYHWLLNEGYAVDLLTQDDLHERVDALSGYGAAVLVGHDEYWSWEMRDALDAYVQGGGGLARFAGNIIMQIRREASTGQQVCYKVPGDDPVFRHRPERATTHWDSPVIGRPATHSFGLTGMAGVYHRFGACSPRASGGFTVYRPGHWALDGTGLVYGDLLGAGTSRVAAFEVDGVDFDFRFGLPYATGSDGASADLEIIGLVPATIGERNRHGGLMNAPLHEISAVLDEVPPMNPRPAAHREFGAGAIVSLRSGAGEIFNTGCCEWVTGLIRQDREVQIVTRNVLQRFLRAAADGRGHEVPSP